jgi:hypothetical protein
MPESGRCVRMQSCSDILQVQPVLTRAGLAQVPFRALRHAATTLAVVANVAPKVTARRLGHAIAALTLDRYSRVTDDLERAAAAAIEMTLFSAVPEVPRAAFEPFQSAKRA